jgi:hypothetical protein
MLRSVIPLRRLWMHDFKMRFKRTDNFKECENG